MAKHIVTEQEFDELKAKHSGAIVVQTVMGDVAFRCPSREEYLQTAKDLMGVRKNDAVERLLRTCVVAPSGDAFDAMLERKPGIAQTCGGPLLEFAGLDRDPATRIEGDDDFLIIETVLGAVKFRGPKRSENKAYEDESDDPKKRAEAQDRYVVNCAISPEPRDLLGMLAKKPGIGTTCFIKLHEFAGAEESATVKK